MNCQKALQRLSILQLCAARCQKAISEVTMNNKYNAIAKQIRRDIINMVADAGSGHPGGSLSMADILAVLYFGIMKTEGPDRDYFVLSKGHAAPALYSVLSLKGIIEREALTTFRKYGSILQGHPDALLCPGIEASTGSLGQGISIAVGMSMGMKLRKSKGHVYVALGDGEMQEGQVWEALMSAAHYRLDNLTVIVDCNGLQIDGPNEQVMSLGNLPEKLQAFGLKTFEIDGHDYTQLEDAFRTRESDVPTGIIAHTIKGKGISFMEGQVSWHGAVVKEDLRKKALEELE